MQKYCSKYVLTMFIYRNLDNKVTKDWNFSCFGSIVIICVCFLAGSTSYPDIQNLSDHFFKKVLVLARWSWKYSQSCFHCQNPLLNSIMDEVIREWHHFQFLLNYTIEKGFFLELEQARVPKSHTHTFVHTQMQTFWVELKTFDWRNF